MESTDDPREMLDHSFEQQVQMLLKIRRGLADVHASRRRVELQMTGLTESSGELERRADEARAAGQESEKNNHSQALPICHRAIDSLVYYNRIEKERKKYLTFKVRNKNVFGAG